VRRLKILTWHVHGAYLYYLSHARHDFYVPVRGGGGDGYGGRGTSYDFADNVRELAAEDVQNHAFDCILFQSARHWLEDQYDLLTPHQRRLPRVFVEHDPPREHPTDTRHPVDDPDVLLVHVTPFNALMWDSGRTPVRVIEHGVVVPDGIRWTGELERGITVVNNMASRGRRLGADVFAEARRQLPLDLAGMNTEGAGGLGEVPPRELHAFEARYRFFFNPIRYTSMGLAVCEAMMLGMPIVGLATTEMATAVENGVSGYVDTDPRRLIDMMRDLLRDPAEARRLGEGARRAAISRFNLDRFLRDWDDAFALVTGARSAGGAALRKAAV
jgi:hypothetical protein